MKSELFKHVQCMSAADLYRAVYLDALTGVLNRRAYDATAPAPCVALADLDSLKFVNDNCGYRVGDRYIQGLATALQTRFGDRVYRLAGDEFAVTGIDYDRLCVEMLELQRVFPLFSFGVGSNLDDADKALKLHKRVRAARGERAERSEAPPWVVRANT